MGLYSTVLFFLLSVIFSSLINYVIMKYDADLCSLGPNELIGYICTEQSACWTLEGLVVLPTDIHLPSLALQSRALG